MVRFLLNNQPISLDGVAPNLSVLDYLRTNLALVGTKEGCAAGDCGACSVVLAEPAGSQLQYRAINACITPVASLHGKQLLTVEHLKDAGTLHPVQEAMVDCHGSQCGFCTPGIVMSLFAWWKMCGHEPARASRHGVETALSGNLCRCTGYQPIFRAAEQALEANAADQFSRHEAQTLAALKEIQNEPAGSVSHGGLHFFIPSSAQQVAELLEQHPDARLVAGATDLGLDYTQALQQATTLIYMGNVDECRELELGTTHLSVGSATTYSEAEKAIAEQYPAFGHLLNRLGSLQIRNQGTLGGNVANASPIGDTPPVLLALNATLDLYSTKGTRRVAIKDFFTGYRKTVMAPGEFIHTIQMPRLQADETLQVYKISKRFDDDISAVCLALWLKTDNGAITDARLGLGGMAATPARASNAEQALIGQPFSEATFTQAGAALQKDFTPLSDVRATSAYRLAVAARLLERAYWEASEPASVSLFTGHTPAISGGFYHA